MQAVLWALAAVFISAPPAPSWVPPQLGGQEESLPPATESSSPRRAVPVGAPRAPRTLLVWVGGAGEALSAPVRSGLRARGIEVVEPAGLPVDCFDYACLRRATHEHRAPWALVGRWVPGAAYGELSLVRFEPLRTKEPRVFFSLAEPQELGSLVERGLAALWPDSSVEVQAEPDVPSAGNELQPSASPPSAPALTPTLTSAPDLTPASTSAPELIPAPTSLPTTAPVPTSAPDLAPEDTPTPTSPHPEPTTFDLTVRTDPPGAQLFLNGHPVGPSPAQLRDLAPGIHTLTAASDTGLAQQRIALSPTHPPEILLTLAPVPAVEVLAQSQPAGATVQLMDESQGATPIALAAPTASALALTLELDGYRPYAAELDTTALSRERRGRLPLRHQVTLAARPVAVEFTGLPHNARLLLDGERVINATTEIVSGVHEVQAVAPGYKPAFKKIRLHVGRGARFAFQLQPTEEYTQYLSREKQFKTAFVATGITGTLLAAGAGVAFFFAADEAEAARAAHVIYENTTGSQAEIDATYREVQRHREAAEIAQGVAIGAASLAAVALGFTMYFRLALPEDPSAGVEVRFSPQQATLRWSF